MRTPGRFPPLQRFEGFVCPASTLAPYLGAERNAFGNERNQVDCLRSAASVIGLSPVTSSAQDDSISELLRFL